MSPEHLEHLGEGVHTFTVKAIDEVGNVEAQGLSITNSRLAEFVFESARNGVSFQCKSTERGSVRAPTPQRSTI